MVQVEFHVCHDNNSAIGGSVEGNVTMYNVLNSEMLL